MHDGNGIIFLFISAYQSNSCHLCSIFLTADKLLLVGFQVTIQRFLEKSLIVLSFRPTGEILSVGIERGLKIPRYARNGKVR